MNQRGWWRHGGATRIRGGDVVQSQHGRVGMAELAAAKIPRERRSWWGADRRRRPDLFTRLRPPAARLLQEDWRTRSSDDGRIVNDERPHHATIFMVAEVTVKHEQIGRARVVRELRDHLHALAPRRKDGVFPAGLGGGAPGWRMRPASRTAYAPRSLTSRRGYERSGRKYCY